MIQVVFTHVQPEDVNKQFRFTLHLNADNSYTGWCLLALCPFTAHSLPFLPVSDVVPSIAQVSQLQADLNATSNLALFMCNFRAAFRQSVMP